MAGELSSHISTLITLCFGETCQRHPCTRCTFFTLWQRENLPRAASYLCCHSDGLTPFFSVRGVGDLGLHLLSRSVTQVTPFLGKTKGILDEQGNGSLPHHKGTVALLWVSGLLWVTDERFGMLILTIGLGMTWNEDPGRSFVWSESRQDASALQLQRLCSARRCPERSLDI